MQCYEFMIVSIQDISTIDKIHRTCYLYLVCV